jgi:hypothetical protein
MTLETSLDSEELELIDSMLDVEERMLDNEEKLEETVVAFPHAVKTMIDKTI